MKINFPDDSNSTRNSTNLNHSKSKSSSRKKNKTPSASHENLNSQLHDKIIKNITETNVDIKRNGKFENVNLFLVFPIFFFSIVRKHQIQQRKKNDFRQRKPTNEAHPKKNSQIAFLGMCEKLHLRAEPLNFFGIFSIYL